MAEAISGTRVEVLAEALAGFGLPRAQATELSLEFIAMHPLTQRIGLGPLHRRLISSGLAADDAHQLALSLWGLEQMWRGACFQSVLDTQRRAGISEADAFPACVVARRIYRESVIVAKPAPATPDAWWIDLIFASAVIVALLVASVFR